MDKITNPSKVIIYLFNVHDNALYQRLVKPKSVMSKLANFHKVQGLSSRDIQDLNLMCSFFLLITC